MHKGQVLRQRNAVQQLKTQQQQQQQLKTLTFHRGTYCLQLISLTFQRLKYERSRLQNFHNRNEATNLQT